MNSPYLGKNLLKKWKSTSEWVSLILLIYYLSIGFYDSSRFHFFNVISRKLYIAVPLALGAAFRFLPCFYEEWMEKDRKKLILKTALVGFSTLVCFIISFKFAYGRISYLACIAICLYGIDTEKALKVFTINISVLLAGTILCSLTGAVENQVRTNFGTAHLGNIRSDYGIISSSDFAAYFVFLLLSFWCIQKKRDWWSAVCACCFVLLIVYGIYICTSTWTSIILCLLLTIVILYEKIESDLLHRNRLGWFPKLAELVAIWVFPVLGLLFLGFTWLYGYGNRIAIQIDQIMHSRFMCAWDAFQKYGIHPFGALTFQHGWGGDLIPAWQGSYDFIDSTFALLLIRYGWILTMIVLLLWVWMTWRAIKAGRRRIAFSLAIIAVHCFSEHHFPELNYNILLATPLCALLPLENPDKKHSRTWLPWVTAGTLITILALLAPSILSRIRAFFGIQGWVGGEVSSVPALVFFLLLVGALYLVWRGLYRSIESLFEKRRLEKRIIAGLIVSVLFFFGSHVWISKVIDRGTLLYKDQLSADAPAIERILASAVDPVYAGQMEELYKEKFKGISSRISTPEEMIGRNKKGTIIVSKNKESSVMFNTGAAYAQISDYSSIYTYDEHIAQALRNAGYSVHGYYDTEREMDLDALAKLNGLERTKDGIFLNGMDLIKEPNLMLYAGDYQTTFELNVDPKDLDQEIICDLAITTYDSDNLIQKKTVSSDEFDESGHLTATIGFTIQDSNGIRFEVYPKAPSLAVNRIAWKATPASEIWKSYDQFNRLILERYFDQDGTPTKRDDGYYGVAYEYGDGSKRWVLRTYLDGTGKPMKGSSGYAQTVRVYNQKKQLIEERYLDETDNLCLNTGGYAICRWDYNEKGDVNHTWYYGVNEEPVQINRGYAGQ